MIHARLQRHPSLLRQHPSDACGFIALKVAPDNETSIGFPSSMIVYHRLLTLRQKKDAALAPQRKKNHLLRPIPSIKQSGKRQNFEQYQHDRDAARTWRLVLRSHCFKGAISGNVATQWHLSAPPPEQHLFNSERPQRYEPC
jgi:hypothetical protein